LKVEIVSYKQGNQEMVEFFTKLMRMWNELENYIKIYTFNCSANEKIAKIME